MTDATHAGGAQWISAADFAARVHVSRSAVTQGLKSGRVGEALIQRNGRNIKLLWPHAREEWEQSRAMSESLKRDPAQPDDNTEQLVSGAGVEPLTPEPLPGGSVPAAPAPAPASAIDPLLAEGRALKVETERLALEKARHDHNLRLGKYILKDDLADAATILSERLLQAVQMLGRKAELTAALQQGHTAAHRAVWKAAEKDLRTAMAAELLKLADLASGDRSDIDDEQADDQGGETPGPS